jgi:4-hydroxy-tetrahydrodipicolinate reductase
MDVALSGAAGAMGRQVVRLVAASEDCELVAAVERADHPDLGQDAGELAGAGALGVPLSAELTGEGDVLIDFSAPEAACAGACACAARGMAVVIGTTGLSPEQRRRIEEEAAARVPVLIAPNMSVGVNLLFALAEEVASALGPGYDVEIVEAHHRRKVDAPSGTAMELLRRVCRATGREAESDARHGRRGATGPREAREVGVHAVRGGDIVGDHTVLFAGQGERLELTHRATSREVFARGALRAARFLVEQAPGLYSMQDMLA